MDSTTQLQSLKDKIAHFCEERDWDQFHNPKELAIGLVTEAAELLAEFRFKSPSEIEGMFKDSARRERVADELADCLFFVLRFSQLHGIDLSEALDKKMAKNAARYPIEKSKGKNLKYNEYNS